MARFYLRVLAGTLVAVLGVGSALIAGEDSPAQAATTGSAPCVQTVGNSLGVAVWAGDEHCYVAFKTADTNTWSVPPGVSKIDAVLVAGGGGGGARHGGGGGAGQIRTVNAQVLAESTLTVTVGGGGAGTPRTSAGQRASSGGPTSVQGTLGTTAYTATGGIGGQFAGGAYGGGGFSGGGGAGENRCYGHSTGWCGGGGAGAAANGVSARFWNTAFGGKWGAGGGGVGASSPVITSTVATGLAIPARFSGGGGGGTDHWGAFGSGVDGGGDGGRGSSATAGNGHAPPTAGAPNSGGGGGASGYHNSWGQRDGASGGSGVVVIKYAYKINPPTALVATPRSDTEVELSWVAPTPISGAEDAPQVSDYRIEYRVAPSGAWGVLNDGVGVDTRSIVSGLTPGVQYGFRVSAVNSLMTTSSTSEELARTYASLPNSPPSQCQQFVTDTQGVLAEYSPAQEGCFVTFTNPGSNTWAVPAGISSIKTLIVGGGGGGGQDAGSGGAGGAVFESELSFDLGSKPSVALSVGAGGAGGSWSSPTTAAQAGSASSLNLGGFVVSTPGGGAGATGNPTVTPAVSQGGQAPTVTSGSGVTVPDAAVKISGGAGGEGIAFNTLGIAGKPGAPGHTSTFFAAPNYTPINGGMFAGGGGGGPSPVTDNDNYPESSPGAGVFGGGDSAYNLFHPAGSSNPLGDPPNTFLSERGIPNTGGGGGAGLAYTDSTVAAPNQARDAAAGGSGVVVIFYKLVEAPLVVAHPDNVTTVAGDGASFSATFGSDLPEIVWEVSTNRGSTWSEVAASSTINARSATLSIPATVASQNGYWYRAKGINRVALDGGGSVQEVAYTTAGVLTVTRDTTTFPAGTVCDGSYTQNGVSVAAGHGSVFYIDTGQGQNIDAGYVGYTVSSATGRNDLWVDISGFTGGVLTLADPSTRSMPLGVVETAGTGTAFFMLKATGATSVAQSHIVRVYSQKPSIGNPAPLYECTYSFIRVEETIKAAANKVTSVTSTTVSSIGATMTITVEGDSGQIGQGNATDGRMFWLIPAARSSWPVNAVRLEKTQLTMFSDAGRTAQIGNFVNTLRVNNTNGLAADTRQYWRAVYTFRAIGVSSSAAPIIPIAMISSGTQIKHTDVGSLPSGGSTTLDLTNPTVSLEVRKNVSTIADVRADGTTRFDYEIILNNTGGSELIVDEVVDTPDSTLSFVTGSAAFNEVAGTDPGVLADSSSLGFTGPLVIPANSTRSLTYTMAAETCRIGSSYELQNSATARAGVVIIGSAAATQSVATVYGNCGESEVSVIVVDEPLDPNVVTQPAQSVLSSSATLQGTIDPNGVADREIRFSYSTNPALTGAAHRDAGVTTTAETPYSVTAPLTGLTPGTVYYYRLEVLVDGVWQAGEILSFTTPPGAATPSALTLAVSNIANDGTTAQFNGQVDANLTDTKVIFEYGISADCVSSPPNPPLTSGMLKDESESPFVDAVVSGADPTAMSWSAASLTPNGSYCVRIVALHGENFGSRAEGGWVAFVTTAKQAQTISWLSGSSPLAAGGSTTVTATASSALSVTYTSADPSICTVNSSGVVTAVATSGNCVITATQIGSGAYYAAEPSTISFAILPPVITTTSLPTGTYKSGYSANLAATGGNGSYSSWTVSSGALPPGLNLNSATGQITGNPTESGIFTIFVTTVSNGITSEPRALTLTINKVVLTVTASSHTVAFGSDAPSVTPVFVAGQFVSPDTQATLGVSPNVAPRCATNYQVGDSAGASGITTTCSGAWAVNYTFTYVAGSVTVSPRPVTITALNVAKANQTEAGLTTVSADPSFGYGISPTLPVGQTISDVLTEGAPTFARQGSGLSAGNQYSVAQIAGKEAPGSYTITPGGSPTSNYSVTFVTGVLTISEKIVPTLDIPTRSPIVYGTDLAGQLNARGMNNGSTVAGTYTYSYKNSNGTTVVLNSSSVLPAGDHVIMVRFIPSDPSRFEGPIDGKINLRVDPFPLVISVLNAAKTNVVQGDRTTVTADPELDFVVGPKLPLNQSLDDVFPNGITLARSGGGKPAGTYPTDQLPQGEQVTGGDRDPYGISANGLSSSNYQVTFFSGQFHITNKVVPEVTTTDSTKMERDVVGGRLNAQAQHLSAGVPGEYEYSIIDVTEVTESRVEDGVTINSVRLDLVNEIVTPATALPPGRYTIQVKFVPADPVTYFGPAYGTQTLTVFNFVAPGQGGGGRPPFLNPTPEPEPRLPFFSRAPVGPGVTPVGPGVTPGALETSDGPISPLRPPSSGLLNTFTDQAPRLPGQGGPQAGLGGGAGTIDFGAGPTRGSTPGAADSGGQGVRSVQEMGQEKLGGFFPPGSSTRVEILGARTGARFVLTETDVVDSFALIRAIQNSIPTQSADFFALAQVREGLRPEPSTSWTDQQRQEIAEFFAASGLAAPLSLADIDPGRYSTWLQVSGSAQTYAPGSVVYLTLTSQPLIIASAVVDERGYVEIAGSFPADWLAAGEHRVRLVGIRSLDGVSVDDQGEVQLSDALMAEIQRFDLGTQSTIAVSGTNAEGGDHMALRVVPLVPAAPWWTLWFILAGFLLVATLKYRGLLFSRSRRISGGLALFMTSVPAVVLGWLSTVTAVVWWGLGLGLLAVFVSWLVPQRSKDKQRGVEQGSRRTSS